MKKGGESLGRSLAQSISSFFVAPAASQSVCSFLLLRCLFPPFLEGGTRAVTLAFCFSLQELVETPETVQWARQGRQIKPRILLRCYHSSHGPAL